MGIFDRWTSKKGKADSAKPKGDQADDAKKKAFASVPSGKDAAKVEKPQAKQAEKTDATAKSDVKSTPTTKTSTDRAFRVLRRPVVTEKTSRMTGQYTFEVDPRASKMDVRNAVQQVYGIRPVAVNILNKSGKVVRYGRTYGRTIDRKKAVVTLPAGKTIEVFSA